MKTLLPSFILLTILPQLMAARLRTSLNHRVVGGVNVTIEQYPYHVSVLINNHHWCGGSILNRLYILTAAHCLLGKHVEFASVRAGSTIINKGGIVRKAAKLFIHPKFNLRTFDYDIGLLKLSGPLPFNRRIRPVRLPNQNTHNDSVDDLIGEATGWGRLYQGGPFSEQLQMVKLPTLKQSVCEKAYIDLTNNITDRMICAGYLEGGKDTCQGDSGGPLAVNGTVIGITSWGAGCALENRPGVYARVSHFVKYIKSIIST